MLKIIHGADFHLDSPFSGLSPDQAAQRRGEQRELLDALARLAAEKQADLVLLSGDLLDGERVYRETAQTLARTLGPSPARCSFPRATTTFIPPARSTPLWTGRTTSTFFAPARWSGWTCPS